MTTLDFPNLHGLSLFHEVPGPSFPHLAGTLKCSVLFSSALAVPSNAWSLNKPAAFSQSPRLYTCEATDITLDLEQAFRIEARDGAPWTR